MKSILIMALIAFNTKKVVSDEIKSFDTIERDAFKYKGTQKENTKLEHETETYTEYCIIVEYKNGGSEVFVYKSEKERQKVIDEIENAFDYIEKDPKAKKKQKVNENQDQEKGFDNSGIE